MRERRRPLLVLAAVAAVVGSLLTVGQMASAAAPDGTARPYALENGVTVPVFSYGDAVRESVWMRQPLLRLLRTRQRERAEAVRL
jgi:hypothetical protein